MDDFETWLEKVYASGGQRETLDHLYDEWAKDYDQQIWGSGNPYIAIATGMVGRHIPDLDASILDVGCGTGNMAQVLHQVGYDRIDGLDPSAGMLKIARQKSVYKNLYALYLDTKVDLPDASYDAVIAAGVLTHGHAPPEALEGILRLTRQGGVIIFSLSMIAYEEHGFEPRMRQMQESGEWQLLEQSKLFRTYPFSARDAHIKHWVFAYRKL